MGEKGKKGREKGARTLCIYGNEMAFDIKYHLDSSMFFSFISGKIGIFGAFPKLSDIDQ